MNIKNRALERVLIALLLLSLAACATTEQVQTIVDQSNAALQADLILAETEKTARPDGVKAAVAKTDQAQAVVARIDAFLAEHQDNAGLARTVNALRLRKALVLLVNDQPNMAKAAFAAYDPAQAGNARDLALFRSYEALVWWWGVAGEGGVKETFAPAATKHIATLDDAIGKAPEGSGIRYYLATLRAHVQLKWAAMEDDWRPRLKDGLKVYAGEFDAAAQENIRTWVAGRPEELKSVPTEHLRWYGQAKITFDEYAKQYQRFLSDSTGEGEEVGETEPSWPPECLWLVNLPIEFGASR